MTEEKTWANISRFQTYLFNSGDNFKSYEMLGSHKVKIDGVDVGDLPFGHLKP